MFGTLPLPTVARSSCEVERHPIFGNDWSHPRFGPTLEVC